jgi:excinuclease ABC subunit C
MLIDGGLGQLHAAMKALGKLNIIDLDVLSLAKKEEIVYLPSRPNGVKLDQQHMGLKILQQVRDEAHRFAVQFQRQKRETIFQ